jgi:hypothetical protein
MPTGENWNSYPTAWKVEDANKTYTISGGATCAPAGYLSTTCPTVTVARVSCGNLQGTVSPGGTIAAPAVTCNNGSGASSINWTPSLPYNVATNAAIGSTIAVSLTANCGSITGLQANCGSVNVSNGEALNITNTGDNTGGPLTDGTYIISAIGACVNVRFNCNWNAQSAGCSIQVNNGTTYSGGHNTQNNVMNPVPSVGATLKVVGTVERIWCANW